MRVFFFRKRQLFIIWIVLGIMLLLLTFASMEEDIPAMRFVSPATGKTVILDPGHGGFDPGSVSPSGTREDGLNLSVANKLKDYLEKHNITVIMTRENNDALADTKRKDMNRRYEIIRDSDPDIVISIHMNKFQQSKYYGAQTFYMEGSPEGEKLAQCIQQQLLATLGRGNRRQIKPVNNLGILKAGSAPSVIVECGFLSNPEEEELLKTEDYQDKIAWAIYSGVVDYFAQS